MKPTQNERHFALLNVYLINKNHWILIHISQEFVFPMDLFAINSSFAQAMASEQKSVTSHYLKQY